MKIGLI